MKSIAKKNEKMENIQCMCQFINKLQELHFPALKYKIIIYIYIYIYIYI